MKEIKFDTGSTVTSNQVLAIIEEESIVAAPSPAPSQVIDQKPVAVSAPAAKSNVDSLPPGARFTATTEGIDPAQIEGSGRRGAVTKEDIINFAKQNGAARASGTRLEERVPMTRIRQRIAERLMQSKNSTAMLTTFNEINLAKVSNIRKELQEEFQKAHGIKLGFMSFFRESGRQCTATLPLGQRIN